MANKCLNKSLPEVRENLNRLYKEAAANSVVERIDIDNRILQWQEVNQTEEFPESVIEIFKPTASQKSYINEIQKNFEQLGEKTAKLVDNFVEIYRKETLNLENNPKLERLKNQFVRQNGLEDFKAIRSRLVKINDQLENSETFKRGLQSFIKGLQSMKYVTGVMYQDLQFLQKEHETNPLTGEDLKRIWQYFSITNEFSSLTSKLIEEGLSPEFLEDIRKDLDRSTNIIYSFKESGVVAALSPELADIQEKIDNHYDKKFKELEGKRDRATTNKHLYQQRIDELKEEKKKFDVGLNQTLNWIKGEKGDSSLAEMLAFAAIQSTDPIISGLKKQIVNLYDQTAKETRQVAIPLQQQLSIYEPILKKYGIDFRKNPESFFIQLSQIIERKNESEDYSELWYLHEFTSQIYTDRDELERNVSIAQEAFREALLKQENVKEAKQSLREAKKELAKHLNDYWFQETAPVVNERYELFEDEIGQELKDRIDAIFEDIQDLQYSLDDQSLFDPTSEERIQISNLWREYNLISSERNLDGTPKTGDELLIAQRAKKYKEETRKFYEYTTDVQAFERAKQKYIAELEYEGYREGEEEYTNLLNQWEKQNTKREAKQSYWDLLNEKTIQLNNYLDDVKRKRTQALEKLKESSNPKLLKQLEESFNNLLNLADLYQELRKQTEGLKDENNEVVGNLISEDKASLIRDVQLKIESTKSLLEKLSGLTTSEQKELSGYYKQIKSKLKLNPSQQDRFDELKDKKSLLGVDKNTKDKIVELIQEISELQNKIPTQYYLDNFNQLSVDVKITEENADDVINSPILNDLLQNDIFEKWFRDNHIKVTKFNNESKEYEEKWERLNFWTTTIPSDEKYIEIVPSRAYTQRKLKDQYQISKIEGFTTDNKGNWLPRGYNKRGELAAKDDKYINKEYFNLKNSKNELDATKFKILELLKNTQLEIQKDQPNENKIWLRVPSVERKSTNFLQALFSQDGFKKLKELPSFIWTKVKDAWKVNQTDIDSGVLNVDTLEKSVKTDYYGNQIITVPLRFVGKNIPVENISLSFPVSITQYAYSLNLNKNLNSIVPIAEFLKQILEKNKPVDLEKTSTIKTYSSKIKGFVNKKIPVLSSENTRLSQIQSIIDTDLRGMYNKNQWAKADKIVSGILSVSSLPLMKPTGGIVNWFTGKFNQMFLGLEGVYYTIPQFVQGNIDFTKNYFPAMLKDLYDNNLGEYSLQTQLILEFDPMQERSDANRFDKKGALAYGLRRATMALREYGEKEIAYSTLITMMNIEMVKKTDDSSIPLSQAFELKDGLLSLKPNVLLTDRQISDFTTRVRAAILIAQGNYAKIDATHLERYTLGRVFFFMRKYLVPLYIRTLGSRGRSITEGVRDEGYYLNAIKVFYRFLKDVTISVYKQENKITRTTKEERANLTQAGIITSISALSVYIAILLAIHAGGDDDDDLRRYNIVDNLSWAEQQLFLIFYRFISEVESMTPIGGINEISRIIHNPAGAAIGGVDKIYRLILSIIYETGEAFSEITDTDVFRPKPTRIKYENEYSRKAIETYGTDRKLYINFLKLVGFPDDFVNPGNAIVNYTTTEERIKQGR
jgi:hypothetical protein